MLKIVNLLKNLLTLMSVAEKKQIVDSKKSSKTNKNLSKSQKLKFLLFCLI